MLTVTEHAKAKLKQLLETESDDRSVGLRLGKTTSGALGVFPDRAHADDQIVEHEGAAVLLVGQEIAESVKDTTIDYEEGGPGTGLVIKRSRQIPPISRSFSSSLAAASLGARLGTGARDASPSSP